MPYKDSFARPINYLRVSVTDRCNLRCVYCMPAEGIELRSHAEILSYEEIARVVRAAASIGITKTRLTGGEPLARLGLPDLVRMIAAVPGIEIYSARKVGKMGVLQAGFLFLRAWFVSRGHLAAGNLALRQQLSVLKQSSKRPKLRPRDRVFWVWLSWLALTTSPGCRQTTRTWFLVCTGAMTSCYGSAEFFDPTGLALSFHSSRFPDFHEPSHFVPFLFPCK